MKILIALLWVSCLFCSTTLAQIMDGTYSNTWENTDGASLTYTLTLKSNGTFVFDSFRVYESADPPDFLTVKGTWEQLDRLLILKTDTTAEDTALAKNLNSTKARFADYTTRHHEYGKQLPCLKFYKSDVFYAKGMVLEKESTDAVTSNY